MASFYPNGAPGGELSPRAARQAIQTLGAALPFHPHLHALSADGFCGTFAAVELDPRAVNDLFRRLVIADL